LEIFIQMQQTKKFRNKTIYYHRVISDKKKTLQELGTMFNISRERVRQIQCEVVKRKLNE